MPTIPMEYSRSSLSREIIHQKHALLRRPWDIVDYQKLRGVFACETFGEALAFINKVAEVAEAENHHPDIHINFNKVILELWTHDVSGLTEKDFLLAQRIEQVADSRHLP